LEEQKQRNKNFHLIEKGIYTEEARDLCQILVQAGCSQVLVGDVVEEVLAAAGISVIGPKMSARTVARAVLEGGIMADIQMDHEIAQSDGLTMGSDGTTHRNVNFESRHLNMSVPTYASDGHTHRSRLVGVGSATDHSSQTQLDGWISKILEKLDIYNQSPLARRFKRTMQLADFFGHLHGMYGDHAKDQIKLAELVNEMKSTFMNVTLGEEKLLGMSIPEMREFLSKANDQKISDAGGLSKWNAMSDAEKVQADVKMISSVVLKLGCDAYSCLPADEKHKLDLFV